jgi:c-di-GMP-binding flagellar brake protein YcgR
MGIFKRFFSQLSNDKPKALDKQDNNRLLAQINQFAPLIRLQDERQLIEVITPNQTDSFQSMILGVDLYNQQLILDEFSPRIQNPQALIGQTIVIRHQQQHEMLKIVSEVDYWDESKNCLTIKLPSNVEFQPRREFSRFSLTGTQVMSTKVIPLYGAPWFASITNISEGGMRILVTGDIRNHLHKNKALKKCELNLANNTMTTCAGRVKSYSYSGRPYRHTEVSIAFESMTQNDLENLRHFLQEQSLAA